MKAADGQQVGNSALLVEGVHLVRNIPLQPQEHGLKDPGVGPAAPVQDPRTPLLHPSQNPQEGISPRQLLPAVRRHFPEHTFRVIVSLIVKLPRVGRRIIDLEGSRHPETVSRLRLRPLFKKYGNCPQLLSPVRFLQAAGGELSSPAIGLLLQGSHRPQDRNLLLPVQVQPSHGLPLRPGGPQPSPSEKNAEEQKPHPKASALSALQTDCPQQAARQKNSHLHRSQGQYLSKYESPCQKCQRPSDFILLLYSPDFSQTGCREKWNPETSHLPNR